MSWPLGTEHLLARNTERPLLRNALKQGFPALPKELLAAEFLGTHMAMECPLVSKKSTCLGEAASIYLIIFTVKVSGYQQNISQSVLHIRA